MYRHSHTLRSSNHKQSSRNFQLDYALCTSLLADMMCTLWPSSPVPFAATPTTIWSRKVNRPGPVLEEISGIEYAVSKLCSTPPGEAKWPLSHVFMMSHAVRQ